MPSHPILRSQANAVFELIRELGLRPTDFEWSEVTSRYSGAVSKLTHRSSGSYYVFDFTTTMLLRSYSFPTAQLAVEADRSFTSWAERFTDVREWLCLLKREFDFPDLWSTIVEERQLSVAAGAEHSLNSPFTPTERPRLAAALKEVEAHVVSTEALTPNDIQFLHQRITYLQEASERLGRKDWINLCLGVLTNLVIGLALAPDSARGLFRFTSQVLDWLVGGKALLP